MHLYRCNDMRVYKMIKMREKLFLGFLRFIFPINDLETARSLSTIIAAATRFPSFIHNLWTLISRR